MKNEDVKILLEKYYNGESSGEEESKLKEFFSNDNIPEIFREDQEIFAYFSRNYVIPEPSDGFNERLFAAIDNQDSVNQSLRKRRIILSITGIAAGLLILTSTWFFFMQRAGEKDTFSDPEIAYAEAIKILHDVSYRLNRGTRALESVGKMQEITERSMNTINKSTVKIEKNIETVDQFTKALENIDTTNKQ